ncbi:MAG: type I DNA topoisomerase [bacterium]
MQSLIIVESPTKAKTLQGFLDKNYNVISSFGHVRDLPKSVLGVDVEKNFEVKYIVPIKAKPKVKILKEEAKKSDEIILATDEDREGEAIAWHLSEVLKLENPKRIAFHEITKTAIEEALKNPRKIDMNLVNAQQSRRVLDRLVGYKLSPFLWKKIMRGLSAGRVQSVAMRLICAREDEIKKFIPQEYWSIEALLDRFRPTPRPQAEEWGGFRANLIGVEIKNKAQADKILQELDGAQYIVESIEKKETIRNPQAPFTTSTLQQTSSSKLGYGAKRTMMIAQKLYEKGHITYHRTDSLNLNMQSQEIAKQFIINSFGEKYWPGDYRKFKTKSKSAQEAHEAIRPTHPENDPDSFKKSAKPTPDESKLYTLIWQRFIASQMSQAIFDTCSIDIKAHSASSGQAPSNSSGQAYTFRANGQTLKFDGFLKVYPVKFEETDLPNLDKGEVLELKDLLSNQHFTQPPARYSEATLIKVLEKEGIGRPSTYAPTLSTIQQRNYTEKDENKKLKPTQIGIMVDTMLLANFPQIVDIQFTAKMEKEFDEVANGKDTFQQTLKDFYMPFEKILKDKEKTVEKLDLTEKTDKICPECKNPMVLRMGRFGKFYACSKFPECKHTEPIKKPTLGIECPKCGLGQITEKTTKTKKIFYGCSNWPKCDFALWDKPVNQFCPDCKSIMIETKPARNASSIADAGGSKVIKCPSKTCPSIINAKENKKLKKET